MTNVGRVIEAMTGYYAGDVKRISHFLKVYGYAKVIGELEGLEEKEQELLEVAALVHDIGIKLSEEKYHSSAGSYQELEGPPEAKKLLENLGLPKNLIDRISYLVGHHHTYQGIDGADYQILVEADFLVNIQEEEIGEQAIARIGEKIFRTQSGLLLLKRLYGGVADKRSQVTEN
jgi:HD superfamily phosphodiesterase